MPDSEGYGPWPQHKTGTPARPPGHCCPLWGKGRGPGPTSSLRARYWRRLGLAPTPQKNKIRPDFDRGRTSDRTTDIGRFGQRALLRRRGDKTARNTGRVLPPPPYTNRNAAAAAAPRGRRCQRQAAWQICFCPPHRPPSAATLSPPPAPSLHSAASAYDGEAVCVLKEERDRGGADRGRWIQPCQQQVEAPRSTYKQDIPGASSTTL